MLSLEAQNQTVRSRKKRKVSDAGVGFWSGYKKEEMQKEKKRDKQLSFLRAPNINLQYS